MNRPATISSSRQKAICAATRARPTRSVRRLCNPTARDCSFSDSDTGTRVPRRAGSMPHSIPVISDTATAKTSTRQSMPVSSVRSMSGRSRRGPAGDPAPRPRGRGRPRRQESEDQALDEQLPDQARATGPERQAHGNLALPRRARETSRLATLPQAISSSTTTIARRTYSVWTTVRAAWRCRARPAPGRWLGAEERASVGADAAPRWDTAYATVDAAATLAAVERTRAKTFSHSISCGGHGFRVSESPCCSRSP